MILLLFLIACEKKNFQRDGHCNNTKLYSIPNYYGYNVIFDSKVQAYWSTPEGIKRFNRTKYKGDFFRLAHHYRSQKHAVSCGVASATIVINAIMRSNNANMIYKNKDSFGSDKRGIYLGYYNFDENDFLNVIRKIKTVDDIYGKGKNCDSSYGIDIDEYPVMLEILKIKAKIFHPKNNAFDIAEFRKTLKNVIENDRSFLIAFYAGHISPIVAYDEISDSVLILDVAEHLNEWVWLNVKAIIKDMASSKYHGYVVIKNQFN